MTETEQRALILRERYDLTVPERSLIKRGLALAESLDKVKLIGDFIAYNNGTVLDTRTNLMWAAKDNGSDIYWADAKSYCDNYRGGGYTDWRMPTQDELAGLYDVNKSHPGAYNRRYNIHVTTDLIDVTDFWVWASETGGSYDAYFNFKYGERGCFHQSYAIYGLRALPVRTGKKDDSFFNNQPLKHLPVSTANELKKDGDFIAYDNGTVLETRTNLMWAAKDNGENINWDDAKYYCENYRGGGYTDWRMPTLGELKGLYDERKSYEMDGFEGFEVHLTELIHLTSFIHWVSETRGSDAAFFIFSFGKRSWHQKSDDFYSRALPVRAGKKDGRFIAYDNETVLDTLTNLMWTAKDNGSGISWANAQSYCDNYRGGGYTDWRMPTQDELAGLYDESKTQTGSDSRFSIHITELISIIVHWYWASETRGSDAARFHFLYGNRGWNPQSDENGHRALPVRSAK